MTTPQPPSPPSSIRRPSDRQALVRWVRDTPDLQEPDWLEWKSGYDLTRNRYRAATAKHLIGFGNRDPDAAARHFDGHGCLLLGVEPGATPGMPEHDSADIETWLRPLIGEKLVYDIHYVSLDGARVLLLAVEPPRFGDDIYCLRRSSEDADTGKSMREGAIFVRRTGKTEPASAADIDRLTERARRAGVSLTLDLHVVGPVKTLDRFLLSDELRDDHLERRRRELLSHLPRPSTGLLSVARIDPNESRDEDEYVAEIERFIEDAKSRWETFVAIRELERSPAKLELEFVNESDENFVDVVLEVTLPLPRARVHISDSDAEEWLEPPTEPQKWGTGRWARLPRVAAAAPASPSTAVIGRGEDSTLVRFAPIHVRPRTRHTMPEVLLTLLPYLAGESLEAEWRATSSSTRGHRPGTVEIDIVEPEEEGPPTS